MHKPLRVEKRTLRDGSPAFATDGAPTDCVALVMLGLLPERPALVVSGINPGSNMAHDITYSGTVAAAMEGAINNVASIAVSVDGQDRDQVDFSPAAHSIVAIARRTLSNGALAQDTFLNVNVPAIPIPEIQGIQITRLGKRIYRDELVERQDPNGRSYYWIGGERPGGLNEEGTDVWAVAHGFVSITPIHMDMTSHAMIDYLKTWERDLAPILRQPTA